MPAPAAIAGIAALIPLLAKVPGALKALYASKHFWPAAIGGTFLGSEALKQAGAAGERKLSREEIALQKLVSEAAAEATKRTVKESRERTTEYVKEITKARKEEAKQERERLMMESFMASQDRQMALLLQAMQAISQRPAGASTAVPSGSGMLGMMRSNL